MPTIASWMNPSLEVRQSSIDQRGVYAKDPVRKGERLAIFGGDILRIDQTRSESTKRVRSRNSSSIIRCRSKSDSCSI